jgi:rhamnosyltransferase
MTAVSVVIPTYQAEKHLPALLQSLRGQTLPPHEVILVDSSSTDHTVEIARDAGCIVILIAKKDFRHGFARNLGAKRAAGDVLVFLTQDALPVDAVFLENLVEPIIAGRAAAVTARQVARPDAGPVESFNRSFNYPETSFIRSSEDIPRLGVKAFFFSNTASAIDAQVFRNLGGFSEQVIVNEDMLFCANLIFSGRAVAYQAEARVFHSHHYALAPLFRRYFDIGVFFSQAEPVLRGVKAETEGTKYIFTAARVFLKEGKPGALVQLWVEAAMKFVAFRVGKKHASLPKSWRRAMSNYPDFWGR